ncbi:MAG TPA: ATP-binding protein [Kofleriaceae bacterium]|nr:ATP-binding protein [Kofleriaceae bacterium]
MSSGPDPDPDPDPDADAGSPRTAEFLDRARELATLRELQRRPKAQFVAVHGRRRIGKTSLLVRWLAQTKGRAVYWVADRSTSAVLLRKFSQALQPLLDTADPEFSFSSWEAALAAVARLADKAPLALVIDELPYLLESVPAFASLLQASWDHALKRSRLCLVVAGSHYHMMQSTFASPRGALYGRTTADLNVGEVGLAEMALFLPAYSPVQLVEAYSVIGGVPQYLGLWNDRQPVLRNVRELLRSPASMFRDEPAFLIHDEIADPRTYLAILEGLGGGARRPVDVARTTGVQLAHIGKYLRTLESLRFVRRIVSVDAPGARATRRARYEVRDAYLRFHFAFVQPNLRLLEQERIDRFMELVRGEFDAYVGRVGYEEVCRRHIAGLADRQELPFELLEVGRLWDGRTEIDVAALDRRSRSALVGECRWRGARMSEAVLDELHRKAAALPALRGFHVHHALFSRAGFTAGLEQRAKREGVLLVEGVPGMRPTRARR